MRISRGKIISLGNLEYQDVKTNHSLPMPWRHIEFAVSDEYTFDSWKTEAISVYGSSALVEITKKINNFGIIMN